jgi:uncharacterized protein YdhG (YjbR/CyaY superfamily)
VVAMSTPATVDAYIATFPDDVQEILQRVRRAIATGATGANEAIAYGMPTFTKDGRQLVYFAGWKHHISVYPVPALGDALEQDIARYRASKGTLRFPLREPVPVALIERIARALAEQRSRS